MATSSEYYIVLNHLDRAPLSDYLMHGYESRWLFQDALWDLMRRWRGRIGECIGERHDFRLLRFHDTPGGKPDEEWLPKYLLDPVKPDCLPSSEPEQDSIERAIDQAFGFD